MREAGRYPTPAGLIQRAQKGERLGGRQDHRQGPGGGKARVGGVVQEQDPGGRRRPAAGNPDQPGQLGRFARGQIVEADEHPLVQLDPVGRGALAIVNQGTAGVSQQREFGHGFPLWVGFAVLIVLSGRRSASQQVQERPSRAKEPGLGRVHCRGATVKFLPGSDGAQRDASRPPPEGLVPFGRRQQRIQDLRLVGQLPYRRPGPQAALDL